MTTRDDWGDPFAEDEAARAREQRRAERAARRREGRAQRTQQQGALAERVKGMLAGSDGDGAGPADPRGPPPARSAAPPPDPPDRPSPSLGARQSPPPPPRGPDTVKRRRLIGAAVVVLLVVGLVAGAAAAIDNLTGGDSAPPKQAAGGVNEITIPEGYDRHQVADLAKQEGIDGDYLKASESFKGFDPAKYGAENPSSLEGFLFPATYELPRKPNVDDLIGRQLDAFQQYMGQVDMKYAKSKNLTPYDVLIIASLIERETVVDKDRKLVAAVIYNRLHDGMQLQIDATIRYAENNWTKPLTESDLSIDSPYNTYENFGLPPTPIGNPGLASIQAAAHPANADYLYYVLKPDGCSHFFTASYDEFQQASAEYDAARAAAGDKAPTDCS
jgi:UPF0755 protein